MQRTTATQKKIRLEETSRGHLDFIAIFIVNDLVMCVMKTQCKNYVRCR